MRESEDRKATEKRMHDIAFSGTTDYRKKQEIFYSNDIQDTEFEYIFEVFGDLRDKKVLIYGVGDQTSLIKDFIDRGAYVTAIDISSEAVKRIKENIAHNDYKNKCDVLEMDCENLTFEKDSFDIVFGRAIIHHLDIAKSLEKIHYVLKNGGKVAFVEPLGTNPVIQLYRRLTPKDRTPDEHPLLSSDLALFSEYFDRVHFKYLYALALLAFIVRMTTKNDGVFMKSFNSLRKMDDVLLKIPGYRLLCWDVIISAEKTSH
ncbi:MAG: methyltransferase domain-containing protein [Candidatus Thiodiazotropha sp. (ex Dulcina madagascariensis)]|nr:methyltransferase domain-containing protein [Candidatus Thiodiazotropha sp. (ex Dulcina madagascariensis)]